MQEILEKKLPQEGTVLLVNAKTGKDRKALHKWAETRGFKHASMKFNGFDTIFLYKCKICRRIYTADDVDMEADWSWTMPDTCFGCIIKCRQCGSMMDSDEPDSEDELKRFHHYNCVIIGTELPKLPRKKKRSVIETEGDITVDTMDICDYRLLNLADFA